MQQTGILYLSKIYMIDPNMVAELIRYLAIALVSFAIGYIVRDFIAF